MSKSGKQPIENAAEIIEKFGGIRPMSSKTNVAVTTIQGWKKRGVIPGTRRAMIIDAANEHNIEISELLGESAAPVVEDVETNDVAVEASTETSSEAHDNAEEIVAEIVEDVPVPEKSEDQAVAKKQDDSESTTSVKTAQPKPANEDYTELAVQIQNRAMKRSAIVAAVVILVVLAAVIGIMKPKYEQIEKREARLAELEGELSQLKQDQSSFKGLVPENWSEELEQLKQQAVEAKQSVSKTVESVKTLSNDLTTESGLTERVTQLQSYVSEISGENGIYALKDRFDEMRGNFMGQKVLDNSVEALLPIFANSEDGAEQDESKTNALIAAAREKNKSLQQTLDNVPGTELKAAAMLLAMTQVRSALNRGDEDFEGDLELLKNMVGKDNTKLYNSIEDLGPHAKNGILSAGGLRVEFQTIAGDAVAASLRGEDVSISEKVSAKFNEVIKVEKDGELITGTETQATLNEAENLIDNDSWEEALNLLRRELRAPELEPIRPWIKEVEKLISSRKLDNLIEEAIEMNFGPGLLGGEKILKKHQAGSR